VDPSDEWKREICIVVYSTSWCPDCTDAHKVLKRSGFSYQTIDIELVPGADDEMKELAGGIRKVPTIIIDSPGGRQILIEPDSESLYNLLRSLH